MVESSMIAKRRRCIHLCRDERPVHSTITWVTLSEDDTSSATYEWFDLITLCALCSEQVYGWLRSADGLQLEEVP